MKASLVLISLLISLMAIAVPHQGLELDEDEPQEPEQTLREYSLPEQHGSSSIRGEIQEEQKIDIEEVEKEENLLNTNDDPDRNSSSELYD